MSQQGGHSVATKYEPGEPDTARVYLMSHSQFRPSKPRNFSEIFQKFLRSFSEISQKFLRSLSRISQKFVRNFSETSEIFGKYSGNMREIFGKYSGNRIPDKSRINPGIYESLQRIAKALQRFDSDSIPIRIGFESGRIPVRFDYSIPTQFLLKSSIYPGANCLLFSI